MYKMDSSYETVDDVIDTVLLSLQRRRNIVSTRVGRGNANIKFKSS